jgi:hypothetical protein
MLPSPKIEAFFVMLFILPTVHPSPNLYTWNLNHDQIVWDKIWGVFENIIRSTLGTWWEQPKNKKTHHPGPQTFKEKNLSSFEPSHWLHEISIFKTICHQFQPGLIPPLWVGGIYWLELPLLLIRWGASQVLFIYFLQWATLIGMPSLKKTKNYGGSPK